jgi:lysylphosphatidylglycerol synthetase-like protein (DUF2156 family)
MTADVDRFRRAERKTTGAPLSGQHLTDGRWAVTGSRDPLTVRRRTARPVRSAERFGVDPRSDEPARPVRQLQRAASQVPAWASRLVFLLGLLNIASGLLHRHRRFEDLTRDFLPPFGAASVAVVGLGVGFGMLVMARGLRQRKQRAWTVVVALLCAAAALHLVRGTEPVQVVVSAIVVVALLISRRQFVGVADPQSRRSLPVVLAALLAGAWATGVLAILAEPRDLVGPWTFAEVLQQALFGLVGLPGRLRFAHAASATESRVVLLELRLLVAETITAARTALQGELVDLDTRRAGYQVAVDRVGDLNESQLRDLREETDRWRTSGGNERGFSMALSRFAAPVDPDCLIVQTRSAGNLAIVLQLVPWGDDGLSLDLVRRRPQLDNGVMELTIAQLLSVAASRGTARVSLNFAMFRSSLARGERIGAGPFLRAWVRLLLVLSRWWQIASLYRAKRQVPAQLGASIPLLRLGPRPRPHHLGRPTGRRIPSVIAPAKRRQSSA